MMNYPIENATVAKDYVNIGYATQTSADRAYEELKARVPSACTIYVPRAKHK